MHTVVFIASVWDAGRELSGGLLPPGPLVQHVGPLCSGYQRRWGPWRYCTIPFKCSLVTSDGHLAYGLAQACACLCMPLQRLDLQVSKKNGFICKKCNAYFTLSESVCVTMAPCPSHIAVKFAPTLDYLNIICFLVSAVFASSIAPAAATSSRPAIRIINAGLDCVLSLLCQTCCFFGGYLNFFLVLSCRAALRMWKNVVSSCQAAFAEAERMSFQVIEIPCVGGKNVVSSC